MMERVTVKESGTGKKRINQNMEIDLGEELICNHVVRIIVMKKQRYGWTVVLAITCIDLHPMVTTYLKI
jgi:hypothetical protein